MGTGAGPDSRVVGVVGVGVGVVVSVGGFFLKNGKNKSLMNHT